MRKVFHLLLFLFLSLQIVAQKDTIFDVVTGYQLSPRVENKYAARLNNLATTFKSPNRHIKKKFDEICENRANYFKDLNSDYYLMNDVALVDEIQTLTDYIVSKNSELQKNYFKVFIDRTTNVNAHNLGEGIILVNLGLLVRLQNVEELAFVLCHEMTHDTYNHVFQLTEAGAKLNKKSKAYKKIKKASKKTYGSYTAQKIILEKILATQNLHSREKEFVADKKGAEYYLNAGFDIKNIFSTLEKLDHADEMIFQTELDIIDLFSTKNYTIKEKHLTSVDAYSSWGSMDDLYIIPDSLKTHPHCSDRIKALESKKTQGEKVSNYPFGDFNHFKKEIFYEYLHGLLEEEHIGKSLYLAACAKTSGDNSFFINSLITFSFYDLTNAILTKKFIEKVDLPDREQNNGYNKFLEFLHNQSSKKLLRIANGYFDTYLTGETTSALKKIVILYKDFLNKGTNRKKKFKNYYYKNLIPFEE